MVSFDESFLRAIPYPAIVALDERVLGYNPRAQELFPGLSVRDELPDALLPASGDSSGLVFAGEGNWRLSVSPLGECRLYMLCPADLTGVPQSMLNGTIRRMHEQLGHLILGVQAIRSCMRANAAPTSAAQVNRSLCQMLRLTDYMDFLQDVDGGSFLFRPAALDIGGLCSEVCRTTGDLLSHIKVFVTYRPPRYPMLVRGDINLLQKLLVELLGNAARAAGPDSELELSVEKRGGRAVVTLSGREVGELARPLADILSGQRPIDEIPLPGDGAGLGMLLIQRVVSLHEGSLMMERQKDRVCCALSLPLAGHNAHLPIRSPDPRYNTGFCPELVALSDLLPWQAFIHSVDE